MSGGLMSGGRMSGGRLSDGLKSYDRGMRMHTDRKKTRLLKHTLGHHPTSNYRDYRAPIDKRSWVRQPKFSSFATIGECVC